MKIYSTKTNSRIALITAQLASEFSSTLDKKCFIFCEDKNTLSLEREIAKLCGGSFNVTVSSFSRYISQRFSGDKLISKTGSALAVYTIMRDETENLKRLKITSRPTLANGVSELIAQLKSAKVNPSDLEQICSEENGNFASKLQDVHLIYSRYDEYLKTSGHLDNNSRYDLVPSIIKNDPTIRGAKIFFVGFSSVTRQIMDIFQSFASVCDCDFVLIKGNGELYTNEIYEKICRAFPMCETVEDKCVLSSEKLAVESGLFNAEIYSKVGLYSDKVKIFETSTPFEEAETVAKRIRYEVVKNKKRYKDFVIECQNPSDYEPIFADVFSSYEIPLYVDVVRTMERHPIIRFLSAVMEVVRLNYSIDSILALSAQRLLCSEEESVCFRRFIMDNAVSRKTIQKPFDEQLENSTVCEQIRSKIIFACANFKNKDSATNYVLAIRKTLSQLEIIEKSLELNAELDKLGLGVEAGYNELVTDRLEQVLKDIENIVESREMTVNEFKQLLIGASSATEIPALPLYNDVVYLGDFKSGKQREAKILFAVGLTENVPDAKQDTALLTDRDLIKMESYKCIVEPKIQVVNRRERETVGISLMSFSEKLFVSFPRQNVAGEATEKSEIIDYLCHIFNLKPMCKADAISAGITTDDDVYNYMSLNSGLKNFALLANAFREKSNSEALGIASFYEVAKKFPLAKTALKFATTENVSPKLNSAVVQNLSASVIENYFSCPYKCFASYNLKLKDDATGEVQNFDFGTMLHSVLEYFAKNLKGVISVEESNQIAERAFNFSLVENNYLKFLNKPKYESMFNIVKKEAKKRCWAMVQEFNESLFKPIGEEVAFGNLKGSKYPSIKIDAGGEIKELSGKVDRIDGYNNYIRIIDYKTGNPKGKIAGEELYGGTNVQLYLYPNAFIDDKTLLAGVYYYGVDDSFSAKSEERNVFIGKTVLNEQVVTATDTRLAESDESPRYNISFKNSESGRSIKESDSMMTEDELNSYVKYAKRVVESGAKELNEGFIMPTPNEKSCKYCKFNGMCGYDAEVENKTRCVPQTDRTTIINAVKEQK